MTKLTPSQQGMIGGLLGRDIPTNDPLEELRKLMQSLGAGGGSSDYFADASRIYSPQFSYLDQLGTGARNNATDSSKKLSGLYGALQQGIRGQEKGIKANYGQGIRDVGAAYNQALDAVGAQFDNTRNNSAEVLQRLGIEQAAPNVVGKSNEMEALLSGILGANEMGAQNALRQGQQSAVDYNTAQVGAAGLQGAEAQTGLQKQLNDFLNQLAGKKADLQSQVMQSAQSMQQSDAQNAYQRAKDEYQRMIDERDFNYKMGLDKAKLDQANQTGSGAKLDPMGNIQKLAGQLYGNPQAAGNAIDAVLAAMNDTQKLSGLGVAAGKTPTLSQLLQVLKERLVQANGAGHVGDWSSLQRIAAALMNQR